MGWGLGSDGATALMGFGEGSGAPRHSWGSVRDNDQSLYLESYPSYSLADITLVLLVFS